MSRVGKKPISLPDKVKVSVEGNRVVVEGPLGRLEYALPSGLSAEVKADENTLLVQRASDAKLQRQLHGLARTLISNMMTGVTEGYTKSLDIIGIGYSAKKDGNALTLQVGFANAIVLPIPDSLKVEVLQPTNPGRVSVSGCDKQQVGQFAARIRAARPPEPYQGKGVRYAGEQIRRKAGKAFVAGS